MDKQECLQIVTRFQSEFEEHGPSLSDEFINELTEMVATTAKNTEEATELIEVAFDYLSLLPEFHDMCAMSPEEVKKWTDMALSHTKEMATLFDLSVSIPA